MLMVTIRSEWVNLAMGSILIWELCDVFQCEYLAFYLAEMFKGTLCRKITFYILFNNYIIIFWRMSLIIYEKKSLKIMLTRLGTYNFVITIVRKELFENETDNSTTFFLISNILFKIMVNDLLNYQNITSSTESCHIQDLVFLWLLCLTL